MLVRIITMLWVPGTGAPSKIDYMIGEGTLVKDGSVVAVLGYKGIHMINVDSLIMWELSEPIETDYVVLRLYDVDYPHTVDIDGVTFPIAAADVAWQEYILELPIPPEPEPPPEPVPPPTPVSIVSTLLPVMIVLPMIAVMSKMMKG